MLYRSQILALGIFLPALCTAIENITLKLGVLIRSEMLPRDWHRSSVGLVDT